MNNLENFENYNIETRFILIIKLSENYKKEESKTENYASLLGGRKSRQ